MLSGSVKTKIGLAAALAALASPALAHTGVNDAFSFGSGFLHPLTGLDHVLAMVTVGMLAAVVGGRAVWLTPAGFLAAMAAGAGLAQFGVVISFAEAGILASVVVLGLVLAVAWRIPAAAAVALAAGFAVFHGFAHGAEMPVGASGLGYGLGFLSGTALLHAAGLALGTTVAASRGFGRGAVRLAGVAIAGAGVALAVSA